MYGELRESVRGLVFFGTPHKGGNNVSLGKIGANIILTVGGSVSNNLLHTIEKDSAFARNLSGDFRHQLDDYRILTFFETRKTKLKKSWFFGRYLKALVVDSTSAKMQVHQEVQIAMDTDHTMMCKFAAKDYVYEPVGHNICTMVKQCIADQKERIQMKYLAPKEGKSSQGVGWTL